MLAGGPLVGLVYGASYGLAGWVANGWGRRPGPARVEARFRGTAARFSRRFAVGLVVAGGLGLGWSIPTDLFLCLAAVFGLGLGAHVWLDVPTDVQRISSPPVVLRQERRSALAFVLSFAVSLGLAFTTRGVQLFGAARTLRRQTLMPGRLDRAGCCSPPAGARCGPRASAPPAVSLGRAATGCVRRFGLWLRTSTHGAQWISGSPSLARR
ncbi:MULTISPECIES: hypothetical protein [Streptomyces]|uniref:MFS transporter n=1 Tax=Streptomyces siderophoricus TaxID=2802281 RepID=A0ABS1N227_9ACTN|nr:hypothetical protein [Streptomyces sp. 9-7]MBL1093969.1 hypothetical protein [Streptomyces sp. 9-7]